MVLKLYFCWNGKQQDYSCLLLIRRQLSLNYSVAQRKNLDINCKKKTKTNKQANENKTNKQKIGWTLYRSSIAEDEPLVKACNEREYKRTHHPYRRRSWSVVFSSLDRAQEQRRSRYHHCSFGTLTSQYAHGKSQTLSCFLCIQELKYPIWNPPCGTASCGRLGAKHSGARRRMMMIGAPASSRDLIER